MDFQRFVASEMRELFLRGHRRARESDGDTVSPSPHPMSAEHAMFVAGLMAYGKDWRRIGAQIPTRTVVQIRTHAQKFFQKLQRDGKTLNDEGAIVLAPAGMMVRVTLHTPAGRAACVTPCPERRHGC